MQRFYHQQSQLREREKERERYHQQYHHPQALPQYQPIDLTTYGPSCGPSEKSEHGLLKHIQKLPQKWNPFKSGNKTHSYDAANYPSEAIYSNTNIPISKQYVRSNTLPTQQPSPYHQGHYQEERLMNPHRQQIPISPPMSIYGNCTEYVRPTRYEDLPTKNHHNNGYGRCNEPTNNANRDDHGKPNCSLKQNAFDSYFIAPHWFYFIFILFLTIYLLAKKSFFYFFIYRLSLQWNLQIKKNAFSLLLCSRLLSSSIMKNVILC